MKKIFGLACFIITCFNDARTQNPNFEKALPEIKDWFFQESGKLKETHRFDLLKTYEGDGFAIRILPERQYANYFPGFSVTEKYQMRSIPIWCLLDINSLKYGFTYQQLVDTLTVKIIIGTSLIPPLSKIDTINHVVKYYPVVFLGNYKKLDFKLSIKQRLRYSVDLMNDKDSTFFDCKIFGGESYFDSLTNTQTEYFFIPDKLNKKQYKIHYQNIRKGSLANVVAGEGRLKNLGKDEYYPITLKSIPQGCIVYKISMYDYLMNPAIFNELKRNNYRVTAAFLAFLKPEHYIKEGRTDTITRTRQVANIFFIRSGDQLCPPLDCNPGPGNPGIIDWDFTRGN